MLLCPCQISFRTSSLYLSSAVSEHVVETLYSTTFPLTEEGDVAIGNAMITEQISFWHAQCAQLAFTLPQWRLGCFAFKVRSKPLYRASRGLQGTRTVVPQLMCVHLHRHVLRPPQAPSSDTCSTKNIAVVFPCTVPPRTAMVCVCPQLTPHGKLRGNAIEPATLAQA